MTDNPPEISITPSRKSRLLSFVRLDRGDKRYIASAVWYLAGAYSTFRRESFVSLIRELSEKEPAAAGGVRSPGSRELDLRKVGWALETASRHVPWRADCLIQVIAAQRWLKTYGLRPVAHIGVRRADDAAEPLAAHAWLMLEGRSIVGGEVADLQMLTSIFASGPDRQ